MKKRTLRSNQETDEGKRCAALANSLTKKAPYKGPGADSEEKHEPASDIDTGVVDSLKALDPERPIREATGERTSRIGRFVSLADICVDAETLKPLIDGFWAVLMLLWLVTRAREAHAEGTGCSFGAFRLRPCPRSAGRPSSKSNFQAELWQ
jgi:hypothetical protein